MERIVIDKIDRNSNIAILEIDGKIITVGTQCLPEEAKEGDILTFSIEDNTKVKSKITNLENRLFK